MVAPLPLGAGAQDTEEVRGGEPRIFQLFSWTAVFMSRAGAVARGFQGAADALKVSALLGSPGGA